MDNLNLEYLTVCQVCGCVFDWHTAIKYQGIKKQEHQETVCPACKTVYQLPSKK